MTLCDWIVKTGPKEVAKLLNVDPSTVSLWRKGANIPHVKTMVKIVKTTKGKVTYRDIIEPFVKGKGQ